MVKFSLLDYLGCGAVSRATTKKQWKRMYRDSRIAKREMDKMWSDSLMLGTGAIQVNSEGFKYLPLDVIRKENYLIDMSVF